MLNLVTSLCVIFHFTKAQFPDHVDLEKLGEVEFKNEKYKILRPSLHKIKDQFQDFMMKKESRDLSSNKILMDKNGFKHSWSTLDETKSRKSGVNKDAEVNDKLIKQKVDNFITELEKAVKELSAPAKQLTIRKKSLKRFLKMTKYDVTKAIKQRWIHDLKKGSLGEKYLVETKFYCPFFGVIKTNHYLPYESEKL